MSLEGDDRRFLDLAYDEAKAGLGEGGIPIGSVLVANGEVIGRGHNRRVQDGNPMAHAEIDCLTRAGRRKTYAGTTLYTSAAPCFLCGGAIVTFGIPRVVTVRLGNLPGPVEFLESHGVELVELEHQGCVTILEEFGARDAELAMEDGGAYTRRLLGYE